MNTNFSGISTCFRPSPDLAQLVQFYWYIRFPRQHSFPGHLFFPNGQVVLALNLADPVLLHDVHRPSAQAFGSVLIGHHAHGLQLHRTGEVEFLCLYLHTEFIGQLRRFALAELASSPLLTPDEAFGQLGRELEEVVEQAGTLAQRVERLEAYLRRFVPTRFATNKTFALARNALYRSNGQLPIAQLSDQMGISYKSLQRLFVQYMGLPPKSYARSLRFVRTYDQYMTHAYEDLLGLAVRNGYYDQSHLIRDFQYFTNTTPATHRQLQASALFEPLQQVEQLEATILGNNDFLPPDRSLVRTGHKLL